MTTTDIPFMEKQMSDQLAVVRRDLGDPNYKEYLIRAPGGAGSFNNPYFWKAANTEGLRIVYWTVSSEGTSDAYNTSPERIQRLVNQVNSGILNKHGNLIGGTIVLEHARPADVTALPIIIKEIQDKGGRFGLVGDLAGRPDPANNVASIKQQTKNNSVEVFAKKPEDADEQEIFNAAIAA
jgi:peptidoglycan/xylan/chitin deacetylase (PgdA/CDA1 family)